MADIEQMTDSSEPSEAQLAATLPTTTVQAESDSTTVEALDESNRDADNGKHEAESCEEKKVNDEEDKSDKVAESTTKEADEPTTNETEEATSNEVDPSTSFPAQQVQPEQQGYLEPILVAMELGQEILQGNSDEQETATDVEECKNSEMAMEVDEPQTVAVTQPDGATEGNTNVVTITHEQLANLFANSGAGGASGNVIVTSLPDGAGTQSGLSIATILQDVVSGIQSGSSTIGNTATIQADASGGSYYLVTQGGTIPIVVPSNGTGTAVASMNLVQATSADGETFMTVNQDALPEGVGVLASSVQSDSQGNSTTVVDASDMTDGDALGESSDHELATAAAAVENDKGGLHEAIASAVPVVSTTGKRRLSNGPRVCEQCNKAFKYPSDLKKHLQIHTDIKKFKCEECNRFFRRLHQLVVHQRIHSGEKPYICKHCGTAFRHDSTLTMHVRTRHEHKRPFKCSYCDHTFGRLSHLRKHMKKVCGPNKREKQATMVIQCKFCEEVLASKVELRKHLAICEKKECKPKEPSQVALHVCNICNKDFASPYNVRRHQLTHSDDRPYECEYCNKSFKEKSSLTKHVKRVHLDKESKDDTCELMVSISAHDQQFEVVSVPATDENLLASASAVSSSNENEGETETVDTSALVHVAASVMVEELLHGESEDQAQEETSCTPVTTSDTPSQQAIFMTESCKSDVKIHETDSYTGCLVSGEAVGCLTEPQISTCEALLEENTEAGDESDVQVSDETQYDNNQHDSESAVKNADMLDDSSVDKQVQSMEVNESNEAEQVVTPGDTREEQATV